MEGECSFFLCLKTVFIENLIEELFSCFFSFFLSKKSENLTSGQVVCSAH